MSTLTITLGDERLLEPKKIAGRLGVATEELNRASVEDLLARRDEAFKKALEKVLAKNAGLYERLAAI